MNFTRAIQAKPCCKPLVLKIWPQGTVRGANKSLQPKTYRFSARVRPRFKEHCAVGPTSLWRDRSIMGTSDAAATPPAPRRRARRSYRHRRRVRRSAPPPRRQPPRRRAPGRTLLPAAGAARRRGRTGGGSTRPPWPSRLPTKPSERVGHKCACCLRHARRRARAKNGRAPPPRGAARGAAPRAPEAAAGRHPTLPSRLPHGAARAPRRDLLPTRPPPSRVHPGRPHP